jgi:peptide methionine sulfoxide reductase MsrB
MVEEQGGLCAICQKPYDWETSALYIDHCHTTGKVRGLLCRNCNKGLGHFFDDVANLARAIEYLKKATED